MSPTRFALAAALLALAPWITHAQDYPKKPVGIIVPLAAGGTGDTLARMVGEELGRSLAPRWSVVPRSSRKWKSTRH